MMSLTECYQVSNVALPHNSYTTTIVYPRLLTIFTSFSTPIFSSSPLNVFFIWETFLFDCSFSSGNKNKRETIPTTHTPACLLYFTFLSIPYNTGIKMVLGMSKCCFAFFATFIRCWHGISVGGLLYLMSAICLRWKIRTPANTLVVVCLRFFQVNNVQQVYRVNSFYKESKNETWENYKFNSSRAIESFLINFFFQRCCFFSNFSQILQFTSSKKSYNFFWSLLIFFEQFMWNDILDTSTKKPTECL